MMLQGRIVGRLALLSKFLRAERSVGGFALQRQFHFASVFHLPIVQFKLSDIGEGIAEVNVKEWHVKVGDKISQFDNLCEVQSDKASVTITSRYDGVVKKLYYKIDEIAKVGKPLVDIEVTGEEEPVTEPSPLMEEGELSSAAKQTKPEEGDKDSSTGSASSHGKVLTTPAVRRLAMENKIDLTKVSGSGPKGRVFKEDVQRYMAQQGDDLGTKMQDAVSRMPAGQVPPSLAFIQPKPEHKVKKELAPLASDQQIPVRGYAKAMVKTMSEAWKIPHFGYCDEVNFDRLVELRAQLGKEAKERGVRISYMPMMIKAVSLALTQFPMLNASLDERLENLVYKASHNVCVAMDTPGGLVVPNIKHCEQRSMWEINDELHRLMEAGKRQQLQPADLSGGTFTLSNIGAIGGTYASPVIFPPQVAIGAIGRMERLPRFDRNEQVYVANIVKVSWAADHRVVDGATMARFSNLWKAYLEQPAMMIASMK